MAIAETQVPTLQALQIWQQECAREGEDLGYRNSHNVPCGLKWHLGAV